ncbi:MAG: NADP-dependent malic enzyme [Candidatus Wildermuthbacteria bacterium]|nr:NADP-dependent malic enzyme [Candidatus Wildermuthbacteria bacterium]
MDISEKEALEYHKKKHGKIGIAVKAPILDKKGLRLAYTPGVAFASQAIAKDKKLDRVLTNKGNSVAIITDGSAVLGLGDIGPEAAIPVMEGKSVLFKEFAGIDAYPISLAEKDPKKIIEIVQALAPNYAGINLEDISAPRCFEIERTLRKTLDIPVFHDDQHGAAIIVLSALINALSLVKKKAEDMRVVVNGAGSAGIGTMHLLLLYGVKHIIAVDKHGILRKGLKGMNKYQAEIARLTNPERSGGLKEAIRGADVFIGFSVGNVLTKPMVASMAKKAIVFAAANPTPEIDPKDAKEAGAYIVATGRSDYPNQINNALVFPGLFKGLLAAGASEITPEAMVCAATCLSGLVKNPSPGNIVPSVFDKRVVETVAFTISQSGLCVCKY